MDRFKKRVKRQLGLEKYKKELTIVQVYGNIGYKYIRQKDGKLEKNLDKTQNLNETELEQFTNKSHRLFSHPDYCEIYGCNKDTKEGTCIEINGTPSTEEKDENIFFIQKIDKYVDEPVLTNIAKTSPYQKLYINTPPILLPIASAVVRKYPIYNIDGLSVDHTFSQRFQYLVELPKLPDNINEHTIVDKYIKTIQNKTTENLHIKLNKVLTNKLVFPIIADEAEISRDKILIIEALCKRTNQYTGTLNGNIQINPNGETATVIKDRKEFSGKVIKKDNNIITVKVNKPYGSAMMQIIKQIARQKKFKYILLFQKISTTKVSRSGAFSHYIKHGFKMIKTNDDIPLAILEKDNAREANTKFHKAYQAWMNFLTKTPINKDVKKYLEKPNLIWKNGIPQKSLTSVKLQNQLQKIHKVIITDDKPKTKISKEDAEKIAKHQCSGLPLGEIQIPWVFTLSPTDEFKQNQEKLVKELEKYNKSL